MVYDVTKHRRGLALAALLVAFGFTACSDSVTGPGSSTTSVTLTRASGGSAALASQVVTSHTGLGQVNLETVSSIVVHVDRVQVHRAEADEDGEGDDEAGPAWVDLDVEVQEIDLISDLADGQTLTVAEGELAAGDYDQVRLFIQGATITFSDPQPVPGAGSQTVSEAQLTIPSVQQTGIKIPGASFTVEDGAGATVEVEFEAGTSVQNINITGTGDVMMTPVLVSGSSGGSA